MSCGLEVINPLTHPGWDDLVLATGKGSLFHSSCWARALHESYGYTPVYFASFKGGGLETLFPFMEIDSPLTGKRGVSLPFTDYCEPILPVDADVRDIVGEVHRFGKGAGWRYAEFRGGRSLPGEFPPSSTYFGHTLDLAEGEKAVYYGLHEGTRRNVRKSQRHGVKVVISESLDAVKSFYRMNCMTRKLHGLPPQPFRFFEALQRHLLSKGHGMVALAELGGEAIAGSVFLSFGSQAMYKYGASDRSQKQLRANNLVMWEAIMCYAANGYKSLCFGRTEPENSGLLQFKRGWGASEHAINYHKYDLRQGSYVTEALNVRGVHNRVFERMPIPLLRLTGAILYRHIG